MSDPYKEKAELIYWIVNNEQDYENKIQGIIAILTELIEGDRING